MIDWQSDKAGRVSLNTETVLTSPSVSDIQYVKDARGLDTFKTKADSDTYAAVVKERNAISHFFLNAGDAFKLVLRVNGVDFQIVSEGIIDTKLGTQGVLFVRVRMGRDAIAPPKPAEPEPAEII